MRNWGERTLPKCGECRRGGQRGQHELAGPGVPRRGPPRPRPAEPRQPTSSAANADVTASDAGCTGRPSDSSNVLGRARAERRPAHAAPRRASSRPERVGRGGSDGIRGAGRGDGEGPPAKTTTTAARPARPATPPGAARGHQPGEGHRGDHEREELRHNAQPEHRHPRPGTIAQSRSSRRAAAPPGTRSKWVRIIAPTRAACAAAASIARRRSPPVAPPARRSSTTLPPRHERPQRKRHR